MAGYAPGHYKKVCLFGSFLECKECIILNFINSKKNDYLREICLFFVCFCKLYYCETKASFV